MFSSIKETNRLISKGMCVLLFDLFNGCSLVKKLISSQAFTIKTEVLKTCWESKCEEMH